MDLFARFKKDYFNYLLSVILPALIMGLSIPVLKHLLGAQGYGTFSIWLNAVLLCTALMNGWITQSVLRFASTSSDKKLFSKQATTISRTTQFIIFIPTIFTVWFISRDLILALLFAAGSFVTAMQFSVTAVSQSGFLSKKNIYSETIRVVSYILSALLMLWLHIHFLYALFMAFIFSYLLAALYLSWQVQRASTTRETKKSSSEGNTLALAKRFFKYGAPLSGWFVFSYLTTYIDKLFIIKNLGLELQGNYQAMFDLLARTLVVVISPVTTSLFPLVTLAYKKNEVVEIKKILKKIILFEVAACIAISILYWCFGAGILFHILKIPETPNFKMTGFLIIVGTFAWLIGSVVHKGFELRLQSFFLLKAVVISFVVQLIIYLVFQHHNTIILYPLGYFVSGLLYIFLILAVELKKFSRLSPHPIMPVNNSFK